MIQPLVSRPPYGNGKGSRMPKAVAELPQGAPADRGLALDSDIPGTRTFVKPVNDLREQDPKDESIYRVEGPDDLGKEQSRPDEIDHSRAEPSYNGLGEADNSKTKYPYRDGYPNTHNASATFVAQLWLLNKAPTRIWSGQKVVVATTRDDILSGLDAKFKQRSLMCSATLKRADIKNLRWVFSVDCGHGPKAVKLKAIRTGNIVQFGKLDLELSCSCPAWRWLGPEYHAKSESFMLGSPIGTASTPDIRDPERDNRVCKHVAAALSVTQNWQVPKK